MEKFFEKEKNSIDDNMPLDHGPACVKGKIIELSAPQP